MPTEEGLRSKVKSDSWLLCVWHNYSSRAAALNPLLIWRKNDILNFFSLADYQFGITTGKRNLSFVPCPLFCQCIVLNYTRIRRIRLINGLHYVINTSLGLKCWAVIQWENIFKLSLRFYRNVTLCLI